MYRDSSGRVTRNPLEQLQNTKTYVRTTTTEEPKPKFTEIDKKLASFEINWLLNHKYNINTSVIFLHYLEYFFILHDIKNYAISFKAKSNYFKLELKHSIKGNESVLKDFLTVFLTRYCIDGYGNNKKTVVHLQLKPNGFYGHFWR